MNDFKKEFLQHYLASGIGTMSKRDVDALVMHILDEQGDTQGLPLKRMSNQEASVRLRAPVARIKSLRYEAMLKFKDDNLRLAKWKFLEVLARSHFDSTSKKIGLVIEDTFTKNWLQGLLKSNGLVFDNSFNTEIVKVDLKDFCNVLAVLYDEKSVAALKKKMEAAVSNEVALSFPEIKKEFLKGAASGLGEATTGAPVKGLLALVGFG